MARDTLGQLLQQADAAAPAPPILAELPVRVRRRASRRRRVEAVAAAIGLILLPLLALILIDHPDAAPAPALPLATTVPAPRRPTPPTRDDLARLEMQASLHELTAAHLMSAPAAAPDSVGQSDPTSPAAGSVLAGLREHRDRAALILVYEADRAVREKRTDRALAAYRRAIDLFPKTYGADVARQRLKEMPT